MKEYAFGIDLGGTTAKVGLFTTSGALLEKWEVPTDTSNAGEHILENLADAIHAKMAEKEITSEQVEGVGIGVPGPVLDSRVVPIICANLGGWGERNVSAQLSGLLDGMNYTLRNLGDGFAMFDGAELIKDYVSEDYLVMSSYAMMFGGADGDGLPHLTSANSPLADYPGYLLDYENPYGAGRITIL